MNRCFVFIRHSSGFIQLFLLQFWVKQWSGRMLHTTVSKHLQKNMKLTLCTPRKKSSLFLIYFEQCIYCTFKEYTVCECDNFIWCVQKGREHKGCKRLCGFCVFLSCEPVTIKIVKVMSMEEERIQWCLAKIKHYLLRENKASKKRYNYIVRCSEMYKYICIKINKSNEKRCFRFIKLICRLKFPKSGLTYRKQVVNPRQQTPQGQSVAKLGTPL